MKLSQLSRPGPLTWLVGCVLALATVSLAQAAPGDRNRTTAPFRAGDGGYAAFRAPTLAIAPSGAVLAFAEGRVDGHQDEGDIDVVLRRSTDGGRTWRRLQVLVDDGRNNTGNACPVVLPSGRVLLVWLWNEFIGKDESLRTTRKVFVMHSDDDGATWSRPREITRSVYRRDWRWYGTGPCHGIVKQLAPHAGRVIIPARHNSTTTNTISHLIYSDDDGATWRIGGSALRERTTECTVVELGDGQLMLNSRNQSERSDRRVVSLSRDGGESFYVDYEDPELIEPRGCQASLLLHSVDRRTGKARILFSNPHDEVDRTRGTLRLSEDDGRTWTGRLRYSGAAPKFSGYSDLALFPGGKIGVLFERGGVPGSKADRYDRIDFEVFELSDLR